MVDYSIALHRLVIRVMNGSRLLILIIRVMNYLIRCEMLKLARYLKAYLEKMSLQHVLGNAIVY